MCGDWPEDPASHTLPQWCGQVGRTDLRWFFCDSSKKQIFGSPRQGWITFAKGNRNNEAISTPVAGPCPQTRKFKRPGCLKGRAFLAIVGGTIPAGERAPLAGPRLFMIGVYEL
jgi:hypothetical protein